MSNDNDVLEPNSQEEYGFVDIVDLLEIANVRFLMMKRVWLIEIKILKSIKFL